MVSTRGVKFKYIEGERVLCYEPDPTKAKVLYDSKVLDLVVTRDSKGRKIAEYRVHFYGWNSSWDRCVQEEYVLSDNEENRQLQKRLAEEASINLKGKKRLHKMGVLLKDTLNNNKKKCSDGVKENGNASQDGSKWQDSDSSPDDETTDDGMDEDDISDEDEEEENNPYLDIVLTDNLKAKLEDDYVNITTYNKLLTLPADPSVLDILETYVKHVGIALFCPSNDKPKTKQRGSAHTQHMKKQDKIHLIKEMADGLRVCFDFILPLALLYRQEQVQFNELISKPFVYKPKDPPVIPKHLIPVSPVIRPVEAPPPALRTRERLPSASPTHPSQNSQLKHSESPSADSETYSCAATRTRSRSSHEALSPTSTSGDESQRLHRVLRSTERLRLEEDHTRKTESNVDNESMSGPDSPTISFKHLPPSSPPPSADIPQFGLSGRGEVSSGSSSHSESTAERTGLTSEVKESVPDTSGLLNELVNWQLLPPHLCSNKNMPTPPSYLYGANHLLRLFVKLPGYLNQMNIPKGKRGHLIKHMKAFIVYFDEKRDTLFSSVTYSTE